MKTQRREREECISVRCGPVRRGESARRATLWMTLTHQPGLWGHCGSRRPTAHLSPAPRRVHWTRPGHGNISAVSPPTVVLGPGSKPPHSSIRCWRGQESGNRVSDREKSGPWMERVRGLSPCPPLSPESAGPPFLELGLICLKLVSLPCMFSL